MNEERQLEKSLLGHVGRAIADFGLVAEGDRILVGVSGGKDSHTLLHLLRLLQRRSPVRFELLAVTLDQLLEGLEGEVPFLRQSVLSAMGNVRPSHLLDRELFDFARVSGAGVPERDAA